MLKKTIVITIFSVLIGVNVLPAFAEAQLDSQPAFTLQQAVDQALAYCETLRAAELDIDRSKEVRDFTGERLSTVAGGIPMGSVPDSSYSLFLGLVQSNINWEMAKKNLSAQQDTLVMQTYQTYNGLYQAKEKVELAESTLKNARIQYAKAQALNEAGLIDKNGLEQALVAKIAAEASLNAAEQSLSDAYQKFNQLEHLSPDARPVLSDAPKYELSTDDDLDGIVAKALSDSPSIWLAEKKVDLAQTIYDAYDFANPNRSEPSKAKEIDIDKAKWSAAGTKEQMEKLVRTLYYSIKQLEHQHDAAQQRKTVAETSLRVAKLRYQIGIVTAADVTEAETTLANAEDTLIDITIRHQNLMYALQKPWAYAGANNNT
ncbi:TolC family protein [Heliobacterium chlorum]|uniref:TolC family protein n=1 Tax=Heliobacterium chlorum TaxID=2698 RepID=A0ABR7T4K1_HELCL|nr:TolC family protein [Heliobacterium chlorum]MBC9784491.1 TolC family protein [Heliobacterium chlorum]